MIGWIALFVVGVAALAWLRWQARIPERNDRKGWFE